MTDDQSLVSGVIRGEESALRALIRKHERLVAHMVGRLVKEEADRQELCQDVFLKVYEKLPEFGFQSKLSTWIATIAYRHAINHLRKHRMVFEDLPDDERWTDRFINHENPGEQLEAKDEEEQVFKFIDMLPAQYKAILTLYHVDSMSYAEISEIMNMPEGTVKSYLFRARTMLKEKLNKYTESQRL
ncbi:MAG: sigma-70 family RNA polymerase sigma factor [Cyclobacteriaceae bacterium]|nr:sigma-70 family RNA polymerase sigma factor [Cyclobacteriaceae bacterium]